MRFQPSASSVVTTLKLSIPYMHNYNQANSLEDGADVNFSLAKLPNKNFVEIKAIW